MPRKSCPLTWLSKKLLLAAAVALCPLGILPPPAAAQEGVIRPGAPKLYEQISLQARPGGRALLFIGGFGDEVSGIVAHMAQQLPSLAPHTPEQRAYYWYARPGDEANDAPRRIAADIRAYLALNPEADIILIGHSMGAATALKCLASFRPDEGRFYLLTLDPVDRSTRPDRPSALRWWGNAYVVHSQSPRDYLPELGGRWNACAGADDNLRFDGRQPDVRGYYPIHDDAPGLLTSRPGRTQSSLFTKLRRALRQSAATPQDVTPNAPSKRASQSESESRATSSQAMTQPART